jgi:hypothetical protein
MLIANATRTRDTVITGASQRVLLYASSPLMAKLAATARAVERR